MTNTVTRYAMFANHDHDVEADTSPDGQWVRYEDIKHLLQDEPADTGMHCRDCGAHMPAIGDGRYKCSGCGRESGTAEPKAPQEKFPGAARNAEEMKIYQAGYDHGFRDGEQTASVNREGSL